MANIKIKLNHRSAQELSQQIYEQLKQLVLDGTLQPGEKILSSRDLATQLKISRPTVAAGIAQLQVEGYVEVKHGSGVYVSASLPSAKRRSDRGASAALPAKRVAKNGTRGAETTLSHYGRFIQKTTAEDVASIAPDEPEIAFYCWRPALDQFPSADWARIVGKHARASEHADFDDFAEPQGVPALRKSIASLAERFRGVRCSPEQIIVVNGLNQGLDLAARLHLDASTSAAVEDPGYHFARQLFCATGAKVAPIAVDSHGLRVDQLRKAAGAKCRLLYVTPSHQFPTGATMSLARRLELLQWCAQTKAIILEDDYDSEFQTNAKPIPALMSLDKSDSVIYLGALNQLMFPSLGVAYLIVPPQLIPLYSRARTLSGVQLPPHLQNSIAEFMDDGHLDRHVKRLSTLYARRRSTLIDALAKYLGNKVAVQGNSAGVFVLATLHTTLSVQEIRQRALATGVGLTDTSAFYAQKPTGAREFILGFGSLTEKQITEGVKRLAKVLR